MSFLLHSSNSTVTIVEGPSNEKDPNKMTSAWSPQPIKPPESLRGALKAVSRRVLSCWENKLFFHYLNLFSHASLKEIKPKKRLENKAI